MIKGTMSESLHIKGIMSKEFSAIRCLDFNGSTDYVDVGNALVTDLNAGDFTLEIWVKPTITIQPLKIVLGCQSPSDARIYIGAFNDSTWSFGIGGFGWQSSGIAITTDWTHLIMTVEKIVVIAKLYRNLDLIQTRTGWPWTDTNVAPYIGAHNLGGYSSLWFNGLICKVRIYNKALNTIERQNNFNGKITQDGLVAEWLMRTQKGNTIYDTSVNSNHGTIYGADWYEEKFNTPLKGIMSNSSKITGTMTVEYT